MQAPPALQRWPWLSLLVILSTTLVTCSVSQDAVAPDPNAAVECIHTARPTMPPADKGTATVGPLADNVVITPDPSAAVECIHTARPTTPVDKGTATVRPPAENTVLPPDATTEESETEYQVEAVVISLPPALDIFSFTADPAEAAAGEEITLTWRSNGRSASLECYHEGEDEFESVYSLSVPPSGSVTVSTCSDKRSRFTLDICNSTDTGSSRCILPSIYVRPPCANTYIFTIPASWHQTWRDTCPSGPPMTTPAIEQVFEGGKMLRLESGKVVYILYNDGSSTTATDQDTCQIFLDTWTPDEPESIPEIIPPEGLYQPTRGFGLIWRGNVEVREALGWALAPEQSFDTMHQESQSTFENGHSDERVSHVYLATTEGHVVVARIDEDGRQLACEIVNP